MRRLPVIARLTFGKPPNLWAAEAFERPRAGVLRQCRLAADVGGDFRALLRGGRIHPDRTDLARERATQLLCERARRVQPGDRVTAGRRQVHAAVLLGGSRDPLDLPQVEAACGQTRHQAIERFCPHQRRRHAERGIRTGQHAVPRPVVRQLLVVRQRRLMHQAPQGAVDFDNDGGEALRAGVESEEEGQRARTPAAGRR
jgi:hypothetical protein